MPKQTLRSLGEPGADTGDAVIGKHLVEPEASGLGLGALMLQSLVRSRDAGTSADKNAEMAVPADQGRLLPCRMLLSTAVRRLGPFPFAPIWLPKHRSVGPLGIAV
jgi:hypothetical protein